ncbi:flagellar filament capping protein FliD [uncultured Kiloniella sp.]|uniref:flagellar filament capping protein FliD n=1 Tax=uncultured Kiloniella sp. TaxID=1133091 RepID=UPI002620D7E9|nr:flagellar filament capping protein FliD [uncultured Kiloniella sp.]
MDAGTLTYVNGSPRITGQYSGFDTNAIVEATLLAKRLPAVRMESTISDNEVQTEAYSELNTLLTSLRDSLNGLRNPPGLSGRDSNIFEAKSGFLTSSTSTPATDILGVSSTNSAASGVYEIEVLQIATANKISSGTVVDATAAQGVTDTITLGVSGGATKDISITSDMSLNDIAGAINGVTNDTGVRASVIKVGDNDFRLVMTAEETGKAITLSGAGNFLSTYGDGAVLTELQAGDKAQIKVDGIATVIERDTNNITDVIEGVTIQLYKAEVGNNIKVEINNNLGGIKTAINDFVETYNTLRDLVKQQRDYDPSSSSGGKPPLYGDDILRRVDRALSGIVSTGAEGVDSSQINTLALMGIELNGDNKLIVDSTKLDDALVTNLDGVRSVFEFTFEPDDSRLAVISRTKGINIDDFSLVIDGVDGSGNITGASVTGYGNVFDITGNTLKGKVGTAFEGMTMVFVGTPGSGSQTIEVKTSYGIAENFFHSIDDFVKPGSGQLSTRMLELADSNKELNEKIVALDARLELTRNFLIEKYSRLEQVLAQADAMRKQLEAQANASKN